MSSPSDDELPGDSIERSEPLPPPPGSLIQIERFPDGWTANIPPAGISGTKGMFFFAVVWNVFMVGFTVFMVSVVPDGKEKNGGPLWLLPLLLSAFWLAGIGLLLGSIQMARRRAAMAITGGTLMVIQTGLFGSKQKTWAPGDVEAVRVGPSGMTVNDKAVVQLQIFDGGGASFGMLTGRRDDELAWLASELRSALKVPTHAA